MGCIGRGGYAGGGHHPARHVPVRSLQPSDGIRYDRYDAGEFAGVVGDVGAGADVGVYVLASLHPNGHISHAIYPDMLLRFATRPFVAVDAAQAGWCQLRGDH